MAVEITAEQADQQIKQRWATYRTCNGNCLAGGPCNCTAAVEDADDTEISKFGAFDAAPAIVGFYGAIAIVAACAVFVVWALS